MTNLQEMKILIIDDDSTSITLMETVLNENGYSHILSSINAMAGLELARQTLPDLILLDIVMPEIDGFEFCRRLRSDENHIDIPIIMVTGTGSMELDKALKKTFDVGAVDFITKPIRAIEFLTRIKSALTLKAARDLIKEELTQRKLVENQLRKALAEIKQLSGMLPICSSCKKIRDDKGYWNQMETYIRDHSEVDFSHGICPECEKKLYPELQEEED
ncbi:MAG: response regulator [Deltaproteobacteria bacterium]|nr:response regulator [Deltaproteobacteria bacterium]